MKIGNVEENQLPKNPVKPFRSVYDANSYINGNEPNSVGYRDPYDPNTYLTGDQIRENVLRQYKRLNKKKGNRCS